ncbi:site-specific integrase [Methylocystis echinoides]|uniref:site-specific integrase n=1 Tax=Methylocystis echinoides TaxID=29468 RepID=UPI00344AFE27
MATFRKRGDKWQAQVRLKDQAPISRSFDRKSDAEAWAKRTEVALQCQPKRETSIAKLTLFDLLDRYEREVTPNKRGHSAERYMLRTLKSHRIASLVIDKLTPVQVAAYRDDRLAKVKGSSVRRELAILQHCLHIAASEWGIASLLNKNPVAGIAKPSSGRARDRRLTDEDARKIAEGLQATRNPYVKHAITFAIATGMRRGELLSLTWVNVDLTNRVAFLPMTKNGEARAVPLSSLAISVLTDLRGMRVERDTPAHVFPLSANALRLAWERMKRRAGIEDLRFHDLRHEAISRFFEVGLSVPEVRLISGHKDVRMLFRYTHLKAEDVAKKLSQM